MSKISPLIAILDRYQIHYETLHQCHATQSIIDTAQARGIDVGSMLKCVLLRDLDDKLYLACTRGTHRVVPQVIRSHFESRRVTCVEPSTVEARCGFALGTLNPILLDKTIPRIFDQDIPLTASITISSGEPLMGIRLRYSDLHAVCQQHGIDFLIASVNKPS